MPRWKIDFDEGGLNPVKNIAPYEEAAALGKLCGVKKNYGG